MGVVHFLLPVATASGIMGMPIPIAVTVVLLALCRSDAVMATGSEGCSEDADKDEPNFHSVVGFVTTRSCYNLIKQPIGRPSLRISAIG